MMKILLLLSACIVSAASQCPNTQEAFHRYLMCIKGKLDGDYGNFESELQADERKAIDTCFASSLPSGQAQHRCVLSLRELEHHAWSKNGPMRDCALCLTASYLSYLKIFTS
uniref:Uncharacterized protein n=1 Tax=Plectus sambesii TaxID=2011161 RepID=A0A914VLG5_9BILA